MLSKAKLPTTTPFTQNTDEGKAQLLGVNTHMQYGVHIRSHVCTQMYRGGRLMGGLRLELLNAD